MSSRSEVEVLVVGAGPVGLFTALLLAKRDIDVRIIDRQRRTNVHSYAVALHPYTTSLIEDVGIKAPIQQIGTPLNKTAYCDESGEQAALDFARDGKPLPMILPQSALEATLESELRRCGIRVQWNHELIELQNDAGRVTAEVGRYDEVPQGYPVIDTKRLLTKRTTYSCQYVVGADGYHSFVRKSLGIRYESVGPGQLFSVYEFQDDDPQDNTCRVVLSGETLNALWPLPAGRRRWSCQISDPTQYVPTLDGLRKILQERAPWANRQMDSLGWATCVRFEPRRAESFGRGRTWLAGDAAHLTGPVAAQSMNVGLKEGHELAWRIYELLRESGSPSLLEMYDKSRQAEWSALLGGADSLRADPDTKPWVAENRGRLLPCIPASGDSLAECLADLGLAFT